MKKKIILLIIMGFILCGCSAEVNITISQEKVDEEVLITCLMDSNYNTKEKLYDSFRKYVPVYADEIMVDADDEKKEGITYYNLEEQELSNGYAFTYSYIFNISNYNNARSLKNAFKSASIIKSTNDKTILISTDANGLLYFDNYPSLESVIINITTALEVLENNADSVSNNVYTWNFTPDNSKNIYMLISTDTSNANTDDNAQQSSNLQSTQIDEENKLSIWLILGIILVFIIFIIILIRIKYCKYKDS